MANFEELANSQKSLGESIQRIITNYKKDPSSRKTSSYYKERLVRLEDAWSDFETTDDKIRDLPSPPLDHDYFLNDYFNKIRDLYEEYRKYFKQQIDQPAASKGHQPSPMLEGFQDKAGPEESTASSLDTRDDKIELIKAIRGQRRAIYSLNRIFDSLCTEHQPNSYYEFKIKIINERWAQIEDYDRSIWEISEDPTTHGYDSHDYTRLEEKTHQCLITLASRLENSGQPQRAVLQGSINNSSLPKLPKLTIPTFDGDYLKWRQFHDLYLQLVHNQAMSNCQKMWYLKTNLTGEPERLLRHFTLSDENYSSAWKLLQERYNNKRLLVSALITKLLSQPSHSNDNPSAANLKALHDTTQECLLGLQNLNVSSEGWDPFLLHILVRKLDKATHMLYEQSLANPRELQTIKGLLSFIEMRFQSLEVLGGKPDQAKRASTAKTLTSVVAAGQNKSGRCALCKGNHPLFSCKDFRTQTPPERMAVVKKQNLCINCLRAGHTASNCTWRGCKICSKKHNTMLHVDTSSSAERLEKTQKPLADTRGSQDQSVSLAALQNQKERGYVLLSTAIVKLRADNGHSMDCRAILDSGSQINLVTERVVKGLRLSPKADSIVIQGIGRGRHESQKRINIQLQSKLNGFNAQLEAFVLPQIIPPQPTQHLDISTWPIPKNIKLADQNFNVPGRIDVLLGAEFYHQLLSVGQVQLGKELPTLQNTVLGWVLSGRTHQIPSHSMTCGVGTEEREDMDRLLEKFWKLEEVDSPDQGLSSDEKRCEAHFAQTIKRNEDGRFVVSLPFADDPSTLGKSKEVAANRFLALEKRLARNGDLKRQYVEFMQEYLSLGHMEEIDFFDVPSPHYFIPHHCVLKPDSSTTKLRVVFDASTKTSTGHALNDVLYTGPTVQSELFSILLRFRMPRFAFTTDIQKMYRQILVQENDRRYQLIFWRNGSKEPLKCYRLCTVTYGTRPAPYLATKCLQKLAEDNKGTYPLGAQALKNDFYVDDGITGCDSLSSALEMQKQLTTILQGAGFRLRKWCANHPQLLQGIPPEDQEIDLDFKGDQEDEIKTLGLVWLPKSDQFRVKSNWNTGRQITKRTVSSDLARLYDPLGIMAPVVVTAKIFVQNLWRLQLHWDEALPMDLHTKWMEFRNSLTTLDKIQFPRHIFSHEIPKAVQIHAFSDASERAYGAAIYIRAIAKDGRIMVRLLCAKSRVAPLQKQTIPRLELCAALISAQLVARVKKDLNLQETPTHLWTDSEIVLAWINSTSSSFHTFVANRVAKIQDLTLPNQWRHVGSKENPADILSRGLAPDKIRTCNLWFYGPPFLHGKETVWPAPYSKHLQPAELQEVKQSAIAHTVASASTEAYSIVYDIDHGNSFRKLQRIIAYMQKFIKNCRNQPTLSDSRQIFLGPQELDEALYTIVKAMQGPDFREEIKQLENHKKVEKGSSISNLTPFLDDQGIIRVGGRLSASTLSYDAKHQMLLPYSDPLTKLLMIDVHNENLHCGPQALLSHVRQRFWPIKGKTIARSVVQHCIRCARAKPRLLSQMMGNLPSTRVQPARPFLNSGVDFCGPVWIHYKIRGKRPQKAYISIFCCFATKAVHMELVSDLSTDAFIGALKRFMARRGHCQNLYCDNATNFVGAKNQLHELAASIYADKSQDRITHTCSDKGINFHFIPPRAPHFGGLWEAAVKSAKHLLLRSVSSASLTYEELETVIIEVEAVLNSRPITPLSTDPNDLTALTPGHFLIGEPLNAHVDPRSLPLKAGLLTRWRLVTNLKQEFWERWVREYLNELQYKGKWKEECQNIRPGTMVIVKEDHLPVMKWPLARVIHTHRGDDGLVRVVDVKTANGILRRPIHRLSPLPVQEPQADDSSLDEGQNGQNEGDMHESQGPSTSKASKTNESSTKQDGSTTRNVNTRTTRSTEKSHTVPKKKIKISPGNIITTLLLACMMMPLGQGKSVEITQFGNKPGIHFENLGTANLITTEWKLVIYYELGPYWAEVAALSNGTLALQHLCRQIQRKDTCTELVKQFEHLKEELSLDSSLFAKGRIRRGAVDIVGKVARSLFGVLDSDYAEEMSKTIDAIKENEDHLVRFLRNQTTLIDSTVNIIKRDQGATAQKFKSLEDQITQIVHRINDNGLENYQIKMYQLLTSLAIQMTIVASNLQRIQSSIIDVLTDAHHGKISPLLLSPQQLRHELFTIKDHLPTFVHLPVSPDDILQLYKLMSAMGGIASNHVIFEVKLPLIDQTKFDLFRVIPIPTFANKTLVTINPATSILAITPHRDRYFPMTDNALGHCSLLQSSTFLCPNAHPIYHKGAGMCSCEVHLLNNLTKGDCELRRLGTGPFWVQFVREDHWIYAVRESTHLNAVCGMKIFQIVLEGSGLMKLQPECVIKHDLLTIQGYHTIPSSVRTSYTRLGMLPEMATSDHLGPLPDNTTHYQPQLKELIALQNILSTQEAVELPNKIQTNSIHHFTTGYLALIISSVIGIWLAWRFRGDLFKCRRKPKPAPRQSRSDFTVHI